MEIKGLNFAYGKNTVIKNLSLEFKQNKITTILGSNGCGKTTLFKLCTRELKPRLGKINIYGENIENIKRKEFAKKVAIVHQQNKINSDITVKELVSYGRNPHIPFMKGLQKEDYDEIEKAIKLCSLEDIQDKKVIHLSGGQLQRAWIAMSIAQKTQILFLDEPTTYLDIKYQIEILNLIKQLNKELSTTIIMILHDINQSIEYSDEIIGLYKGQIEFQGSPDEIITKENISKIYGTPFVIEDIKDRKIVLPRREL